MSHRLNQLLNRWFILLIDWLNSYYNFRVRLYSVQSAPRLSDLRRCRLIYCSDVFRLWLNLLHQTWMKESEFGVNRDEVAEWETDLKEQGLKHGAGVTELHFGKVMVCEKGFVSLNRLRSKQQTELTVFRGDQKYDKINKSSCSH